MPILVITAAAIVVLSLIGSTRRIGFWGTFFASCMLTPIVGLVLVLLSGPRAPSRPVRS